MVKRVSRYPVLPLILQRWSSRALSGEPLSQEERMTLFEAARWAPSCFNNQPWRFVYFVPTSKHWTKILDLMEESNRVWAQKASMLAVIIAKKTFDYNGKPDVLASFDTGAACENMALQAMSMDLVFHIIAGFDYTQVQTVIGVPEGYLLKAMAVIGKPGKISELPQELAEREKQRSERKALEEIVCENIWKW